MFFIEAVARLKIFSWFSDRQFVRQSGAVAVAALQIHDEAVARPVKMAVGYGFSRGWRVREVG